MNFIKNLLSIAAAAVLTANVVSLDTSAANIKITEIPLKYVHYSENEYFDSMESLSAYVREKMTVRTSEFQFSVPSDWDGKETVIQVIRDSLSETDRSNQGDYLRKSINSVEYSIGRYNGSIIIVFVVDYVTNAEQEEFTENKINQILNDLDIQNKSDYDKIAAIYNYIINNVVYNLDTEGFLKYTAYGALYNGEAVCQGISQLFYRMTRQAGISSRMIIGDAGGPHAWNIAQIDGLYYLLDPTFDLYFSSVDDCQYFLRGTEDFDDYQKKITHIPASSAQELSSLDYDYSSEEFTANYPIAATKYVLKPLQGDLNNDRLTDSADASIILETYAALSTGNPDSLDENQKSAADVNSDGEINAIDASMVLEYYAYVSTEKYIEPDKFFEEKVI